MGRSLHVFNALLAFVAVSLGTVAVRTVLDRSPGALTPAAARDLVATTATMVDQVGPDPAPAPPDASDILLRGQPFGKPLPAPEPPPLPAARAVAASPAAPLPTLLGTLRVGDENRALLKDGSRTDLFAVGDTVAGGTLVEIHTDRVVIKRGETLGEVALKTAIKAVPAPAAPESAPTGDPEEPRRRRRRPGGPPASVPSSTTDAAAPATTAVTPATGESR